MNDVYIFIGNILSELYEEKENGCLYFYFKENTLVAIKNEDIKVINLYFTEAPDLAWEYEEYARVTITEKFKILGVEDIDEQEMLNLTCRNTFISSISNPEDELKKFNVYAFKNDYFLGSIGKGSDKDGEIRLTFEDVPFTFILKRPKVIVTLKKQ